MFHLPQPTTVSTHSKRKRMFHSISFIWHEYELLCWQMLTDEWIIRKVDGWIEGSVIYYITMLYQLQQLFNINTKELLCSVRFTGLGRWQLCLISRHCPSIHLEWLKKTNQNLSQYSQHMYYQVPPDKFKSATAWTKLLFFITL